MMVLQAGIVAALMAGLSVLALRSATAVWGLVCFLAGFAAMGGLVELAAHGLTFDAVVVLTSAAWLVVLGIWRGAHL
jgi:hypothetical protein